MRREVMEIRDFQQRIYDQYFEKDNARGIDGTFLWFVEEVGELARGLKSGDRQNLEEEFADVLAWLCSMASIKGIDLEKAALAKYGDGCPRCTATPCECAPRPWE
jgi:NTP pyrophosphatase (non-canonical NTP hydrolase)